MSLWNIGRRHRLYQEHATRLELHLGSSIFTSVIIFIVIMLALNATGVISSAASYALTCAMAVLTLVRVMYFQPKLHLKAREWHAYDGNPEILDLYSSTQLVITIISPGTDMKQQLAFQKIVVVLRDHPLTEFILEGDLASESYSGEWMYRHDGRTPVIRAIQQQ